MLDRFAVPDDLRALPGGQGGSVLAGDLVLSPGRDPLIVDTLNPGLARLAADLDTRGRRDIRIAMPIPARDGNWVIEGWSASRYEPGSRACTDAEVVLATGALLHAELALGFRSWPLAARPPRHRWDLAERVAFGDLPVEAADVSAAQAELAREALRACTGEVPGPDQLVHGDLAGNVLLDGDDTPVVIDFAPYWRPTLWADAVSALDLTLWFGADPGLLRHRSTGAARQAMLRAVVYRVLSDPVPGAAHLDRYRKVLTAPA